MNTYRFRTPRIALGLMAVAMSAASFALMVALPSHMEQGSRVYELLATSNDARPCLATPGPAIEDAE